MTRELSQLPGVKRRVSFALALIAATVCTVVVASAAAADGGTESNELRTWRVHNFTGHILTDGDFLKREGDNIARLRIMDLQPGDFRESTYEGSSDSWNLTEASAVCYEHTRWMVPWEFTSGTRWRDIYVLFSGGRLFLTPEGAHDDRPMEQTGIC